MKCQAQRTHLFPLMRLQGKLGPFNVLTDLIQVFGAIRTVTAYRLQLNNTTGSVDRKSTRLNSSHVASSYAVFCLKKKKQQKVKQTTVKMTSECNHETR